MGIYADDATSDTDGEYAIELEARGAGACIGTSGDILCGEEVDTGDEEVGFGQSKLLELLTATALA